MFKYDDDTAKNVGTLVTYLRSI